MNERPAQRTLKGLREVSEWIEEYRKFRVTLPNGEVRMMTFDEYADWLEKATTPQEES